MRTVGIVVRRRLFRGFSSGACARTRRSWIRTETSLALICRATKFGLVVRSGLWRSGVYHRTVKELSFYHRIVSGWVVIYNSSKPRLKPPQKDLLKFSGNTWFVCDGLFDSAATYRTSIVHRYVTQIISAFNGFQWINRIYWIDLLDTLECWVNADFVTIRLPFISGRSQRETSKKKRPLVIFSFQLLSFLSAWSLKSQKFHSNS